MNWPDGATISHSIVSMQAHELIIDTITDNEHAEAVITKRAQR